MKWLRASSISKRMLTSAETKISWFQGAACYEEGSGWQGAQHRLGIPCKQAPPPCYTNICIVVHPLQDVAAVKCTALCGLAGPALMEEDLPQVREATCSFAQQVELRHMVLLTSVLARSRRHSRAC